MGSRDPRCLQSDDLTIGPWEPKRSAGITVKYMCRWSNGRLCAELRYGDVRLSKYSGKVTGINPFKDGSRFGQSPYRLWSWENISFLFAVEGYVLPPVPDDMLARPVPPESRSAAKVRTYVNQYGGGSTLSQVWYEQWRKRMLYGRDTLMTHEIRLIPEVKSYAGEGLGLTLPDVILSARS